MKDQIRLSRRNTLRASVALSPRQISNTSASSDIGKRHSSIGSIVSIHEENEEVDMNFDHKGANLDQLGSLCCRVVEATNFQVCPGMLQADQVHLRNVRYMLQSSKNGGVSVPKFHDKEVLDEDLQLYNCVMETECLWISHVAQIQYHSNAIRTLKKVAPSSNPNKKHTVHRRSSNQSSSKDNIENEVMGESKFICVLRRTNMPLFSRHENDDDDVNVEEKEEEDDVSTDGTSEKSGKKDKVELPLVKKKALARKYLESTSYAEVVSTPFLICMTFNDSLTSQYIMQNGDIQSLEQIIREQPFDCCVDLTEMNKVDRPTPISSNISLMFRTGEALEIEILSGNELSSEISMQNQGLSEVYTRRASMAGSGGSASGNTSFAKSKSHKLKTDRFLWALIQLHAILVSTDEDFSMETGVELQPSRNVDFQKLHYIAAVNGFLAHYTHIFALIEREHKRATTGGVTETSFSASDIFSSEIEAKEAEEVLNNTSWSDMTTEELIETLKKRMHELEKNACRRLIAWEDEKNRNRSIGKGAVANDDSQSIHDLFDKLEMLDSELLNLQNWLQERAVAMKPYINDCFEIEKENKALVVQWESFKKVGYDLGELLDATDLSEQHLSVIKDPLAIRKGLYLKEDEVETITNAGRALKHNIDKLKKSGSIHLRAVYEKGKELLILADNYCDQLAVMVNSVMSGLSREVFSKILPNLENKNHKGISKVIRDAQRKFHSSLLIYIPFIEILTHLKPKAIVSLRETYTNIIVEGLLSNDLMQRYFSALPGGMEKREVINLSKYPVSDLNKRFSEADFPSADNSKAVKIALNEILPVVVREAFFTSAFFRLSRNSDGRSKKTNFEIAKSAVDIASSNFRFHLARCCGLGSLEGKGDPMLAFVASFLLNEAMEGYFDKQKKGGDHALSLAYIRSTILDLRKQVDKQWGTWVDQQISWIKTSEGMNKDGKRVGVLPSFARMPSYLDHVILSCKGLADPSNLGKVKVVCHFLQKLGSALFESLLDCCRRPGVDQIYVANILRMENSFFFFQMIKSRPELSILFQKQMANANSLCKSNLAGYISFMIRREFKGLYQLFSQISKMRRDVGDDAKQVQSKIPKVQVVKILSAEAGREHIEGKIIRMYERTCKHLSKSSGLLPFAWKALVKDMYELFGRWEKLCMQCYGIALEPNAVDIVRIAKEKGAARQD